MSPKYAYLLISASLLFAVPFGGWCDDVSKPETAPTPEAKEELSELNRRLVAGHSLLVEQMMVQQGNRSPFFNLVSPENMEGLLNTFHLDHGGVDSPESRQLLSDFIGGLKTKASGHENLHFDALAIQDQLKNMLGASVRMRGCHMGSGECGSNTPDQTAETDSPTVNPVMQSNVAEQRLRINENIARTMEELYPSNPAGPKGMAEVHQARNNHAATVKYYQTAIQRGGETSSIRSRKSRSHYEMGDYKNAFADARRALQLDRRNREAFTIYKLTKGRLKPSDMIVQPLSLKTERAIKREQAARAAKLEIAAKAPPADMMSPEEYKRNVKAKTLTTEAITKVRVDDRKAAKKLLLKAIETYPKYTAAYANLASLLVQEGHYDDALDLLRTGLTARPKSADLWIARAFVNNKRGEFDDGLRDASNAIRYSNKNGYGWFQRAYSKAGLRDREASLLDLDEAAKRDHQFRVKLKAAKALPEDGDPLLLYDAMMAESRAAPKAPKRPRPPWVYLVFGLIAAGLAAIGLRLEPVRERITRSFRRKDESSSTNNTSSGFWKGYRIVREIAAGGMGIVYEAVDTRLDRRVAIKCMRDEIKNDSHERQRFLDEAQLVAKLEHRNIVSIKGIEEDSGDVYLVFEYVEGRTLHEAIADNGSLTLVEARDLFKEVCAALEFAHSKKVVHRDLKPANIMITVSGEVKVMDFGIARQAQEALEKLAMTNTVMGTPPYMSPEQEDGMVGKAADIFALGVCLYEALSGELPFVGTPAAQLVKKKEGAFKPFSSVVQGLPAELDAFIASTLHPDPLQRLGSAAEFYQRLESITAQASSGAAS